MTFVVIGHFNPCFRYLLSDAVSGAHVKNVSVRVPLTHRAQLTVYADDALYKFAST